MGINRYAAKRDANEPAIILGLRKVGATVYQLSGKGIPDLLVGFRGVTYLLEVKERKGKLTNAQDDFMSVWEGQRVYIARTVEAALAAIGAAR